MKFKISIIVIYFYGGNAGESTNEMKCSNKVSKRTSFELDSVYPEKRSKGENHTSQPSSSRVNEKTTGFEIEIYLLERLCKELKNDFEQHNKEKNTDTDDSKKIKQGQIKKIAEMVLERMNFFYKICSEENKQETILNVQKCSDALVSSGWSLLFEKDKEIMIFDGYLEYNKKADFVKKLAIYKERMKIATDKEKTITNFYRKFAANLAYDLNMRFAHFNEASPAIIELDNFQVDYLLIAEIFNLQKYFRNNPMLLCLYNLFSNKNNGFPKFLFVRYLSLFFKRNNVQHSVEFKPLLGLFWTVSCFIDYILFGEYSDKNVAISIRDSIPNPTLENSKVPLYEMCEWRNHSDLNNIFILSMPKPYIDYLLYNQDYNQNIHPKEMLKAILLEYLYKHLMLNEMFSFSVFEEEKYLLFLKKLEKNVLCYGCLMEECMAILQTKRY
ncbi:hypothetical protein NGRA_2861 [Nosema granulosis]|uniref:Uncharacterized protein n=1 Tax=Nosema granulosis TaxID=83296 RepID=A0A9P6KXB0_9MICR|nr:hypothetical protein NGRA_2861 [Nosema granulosis]